MRLRYKVGMTLLFLLAFSFASHAGQDIYINSESVEVASDADSGQILVFEDTVAIEYCSSRFEAESAVVWVKDSSVVNRGQVQRAYNIRCYLENGINITRAGDYSVGDIDEYLVERGKSLVIDLLVSGNVNLQSNSITPIDPYTVELFRRAVEVANKPQGKLHFNPDAIPPRFRASSELGQGAIPRGGLVSKLFGSEPSATELSQTAVKQDKENEPVNVAALWKPAPEIEKTTMADGRDVITVIGRFYIWQKRGSNGEIVEFQADRAVLFLGNGEVKAGSEQTGRADILASGDIESVYIEGDIVFTEGMRTIRADSMYYNFAKSQALAINSMMTRFEPGRDIPIFIKADKLIQKSESVFSAEGVQISSDEFYLPQLSLNASKVVLSDRPDLLEGKNSGFSAELEGVSAKYYDKTIFKSSSMVTGLERPELAIRKMHLSNSSAFGTSFETQWYLSRLLGYREPDGFSSSLNLDWFSDRGLGVGIDTEYETDDYFGNIESYVIQDHGDDRLGNLDWQKDIAPESDIRGRFKLQHREYLSDDWQFTAELNYLSDRNFLESFYRTERYTTKELESLVEMKNISGNRAYSVLAKFRLNDFQDQLEELPTFQYHKTGESILDDTATYYGDTQLSRLRQRYDEDNLLAPEEGFFTYGSTRHEIDIPMIWGKTKYVPYAAASYVYNDGEGFYTGLDGNLADGDNDGMIGEVGLRASTYFWKTDQFAKSDFWDINGIRHYVRPHMEVAYFQSSEDGLEMRNLLNVGLSQRWQTRRGSQENLRTAELMRLDINSTFVADSQKDDDVLPVRYVFNNPYEPFYRRSGGADYSISRNTVDADYSWNLSDTFTLASYANYDLQSGDLQQFDIGFAKFCWPDLSWYVGTRYLKNIILTDAGYNTYYEKGSNTINLALSYRINPRYTLSVGQEYDFDFTETVRSEFVLIRKYRRLLYSIGYSIDESMDSSTFTVSIWPQGVKEFAIGSRTYVGLTGSSTYE